MPQRKSAKFNGFVYIMLRADGLWKLGSSVNVVNRNYTLQSHFGQPLQIRMTWMMGNVAAVTVERVAHRLLSSYRINGFVGREVYRATRRQLVDAVEAAIETAEQILPDGLYEAIPEYISAASKTVPGVKIYGPPQQDKAYRCSGPFDWPEIKSAIDEFNANPPAGFDPEKQFRMGFIRSLPDASSEDQRRWMMSQGVSPIDQWVYERHGKDSCQHAINEVRHGDLFYLWSEGVLPPAHTAQEIERLGARVVFHVG